MGQKTHPIGFRLGYTTTWKSRWFNKQNYAKFLHDDLKIREFVKKELVGAAISKVEIERTSDKCIVYIFSARPGVIIGTKGSRINEFRDDLQKFAGKNTEVEIREIDNAELDGQLVAENIAQQLEKRMGFRRAMKKALSTVMKLGAQGCKVQIKGRLGGAEMARTEHYSEGRVPLQMLRADIDYGQATAFTIAGTVGVKVWIFHGEILQDKIGDFQIERKKPRPSKKKRRKRGGKPGGGGNRNR